MMQKYLMDVIGMFLFLALCPSVSPLELIGSSVHDVRLGLDARVPLLITVDKPPVDLKHLTIFWHFLDKEILIYDKTVYANSHKYSLSPEELLIGIVILVISNVQISDRGRYKCFVSYNSERKEKDVWLDIGASPQVTITDKTVVLNVDSDLRCSATGYFPQEIRIEWFRNGEKLEDNIIGDSRRNLDRTYSVDSTVTITPTEEDREQTYSCRVQHKYLQEPLQKDFRLVYEDRSSAGIVAACSVSVIILIIIITAVLWWRRRRMKVIESFTVGDIMGPHKLIAGEKAVLYCTADNAPEDLCVTWLIRRAGEEQEIQTSKMRKYSEGEEMDLLDTSYMMTSQRERHPYISSMSFIPEIERDKDATVICRVVYGKRKDEKKFDCKTIYGKPEMSDPIEITMEDSAHVQFSLTLQKFYPKDIKISWHREDTSEPSESETIKLQDNNVTYGVTSVTWIPVDVFKDPKMKITVMWEHESVWMSETRSLSVRDLPWHPDAGAINVPKLENGREATLTCDISEYFPALLSVFWFTKKDGKVLPIDSSKTYRNYKMSQKERIQTDNTYSCEASLTFTPKMSLDQGSEIICRVKHPSMKRPIEQSTGPLYIVENKEVLENPTNSIEESVTSATRIKETDEEEEETEDSGAESQENTRMLTISDVGGGH